jgi:hypothetical protein
MPKQTLSLYCEDGVQSNLCKPNVENIEYMIGFYFKDYKTYASDTS